MSHDDELAERLHAVIGLKPWDEIGAAQGIYHMLAAEARAYFREFLTQHPCKFSQCAILALLEPQPPK
jgi:hypothetical protein